MGFSMNETIVQSGASLTMEYKNHLEGCYCVFGTGSEKDHATGAVHKIKAVVSYTLDQLNNHTLTVDDWWICF
jgi:L-ectoine synthase